MKVSMIKLIVILLLFIAIMFCTSCSDNPVKQTKAPSTWIKFFGKENIASGNSVLQTLDGGYIITGSTTFGTPSNTYVYIMKADSYGDIMWEQLFGGTGRSRGKSIRETSDGGFIIVGSTSSYSKGSIYLIKLDSKGNLEWSEVYEGTIGNSVCETNDNGFLIVGETSIAGAGANDVYLIKTDSIGNLIWSKTFGGLQNDWGNSLYKTSNGNYIIAGTKESVGATDVYIIKVNKSGNLIWEKTFGGTGRDFGESVYQTSDGGFIITGETEVRQFDFDIYLVKINSNGNLIWEKTFGGTKGDVGKSVSQTSDGGFIITGYTYSSGAGSADLILLKTNHNGLLSWEYTIGGASFDYGESVCEIVGGGFIITGGTSSFSESGYLIKTDSLGNVE